MSFIKLDAYLRYLGPSCLELRPSSRSLRNLSNQIIDIAGVTNTKLVFQLLSGIEFEIDLFVLSGNTFEGDIIIGRKF